jgi:dTDP-4-amino-4,6-dideoxygalactose transaminase
VANPYDTVRQFEQTVADYCGALEGVAVESCSAALFLACIFNNVRRVIEVGMPKSTYPSAPAAVIHAGGRVRFFDDGDAWKERGWYSFDGTQIVDSAKCMCRGMYLPATYTCLSFHAKKVVPIGRGGMILTDSRDAARWFRVARFDGRHEQALAGDRLEFAGWNCYMTPEQAARGLELMQWIGDWNVLPPDPYQDLSQYDFYTKANR